MIKYIFLLLIVIFENCSSLQKEETSLIAEDYVCEEENSKDCKYPFENY